MVKLDNLFKRISDLNLNAKKVSDATNISSGNISDWKNSRSLPTAPKLDILADYLNCSIDYLLGRTDTTATSHIPDNLQKYLTKNRFSTFIEIEKILIEPEKTNSSKFYCFNTDNIDTLLEIYKLVENYSEYNSYNISLDIDEDGFKNLFKCYKNEISTENYYTMSINDFKNIFKPLYEQYTICYLIELANNLLKDNFKNL